MSTQWCQPLCWVSHGFVPCQWRLTTVFQGMSKHKGARQGRLGQVMCAPLSILMGRERRLTAVFQGMSKHKGARQGWFGPCHVPWEWRLTAVFQGMSTRMHCQPPCWVSHDNVPSHPSLWQRRLTAVFEGIPMRMHCQPPCWVSHSVFQGMGTRKGASPHVGCPTIMCHANGG